MESMVSAWQSVKIGELLRVLPTHTPHNQESICR